MSDEPRYLNRTVQLREFKDPEMFEALAKVAARENRTLAGQARHYLKRSLEADGYDMGQDAA